MSGNNVDIPEVDNFSDDLHEASTDIRSQLDKVKESIETINSMDSFSGKAAKEAKSYFSELHLTILESFRGLFDDLEENLQQHLNTFESNVDANDSAIIESNYLQKIKEEVNEVFADLEEQDKAIHDTIKNVSDISSATPPSFSDVDEWEKKSIKKLEELDEDLESFTGVGDETDVKEIMHQIETAMNNAKTSEGKARFADFKGASNMKELTKLQDYNESKQEEWMEKAKDARDSALQDQNKHSSRDVINKAYEEYKNGDIKYDQYTAILDQVEKTNKNLNEEALKRESTDSFIEYLEDRDMLEQYLDDHQPWAEYVVDEMPNMLFDYGTGTISLFAEGSGKKLEDMAEGMMKSDEKIASKMKINDPEYTKKAEDLMKKGKNFTKAGNAIGGAFMVGDIAYGMYDDTQKNDMTSGEAYTHNAGKAGAAIVGDAAAVGMTTFFVSNPGGWAVAAGIAGATVTTWGFNYLYDNNVMGIHDKLDSAGEKVDEFTDWAGEKIYDFTEGVSDFEDDVAESARNMMDSAGDAVESGLDFVNPFS